MVDKAELDAAAEELEKAEAERQWPCTVKLTVPVELGKGDFIEELTFRRGQQRDMQGIKMGGDGISTDDLTKIAARMCGRSVEVLGRLDQDDMGEVNAIALGFYGKFLKTGKKRSR